MGEDVDLEDADGAVPDDGFRFGNFLVEFLDGDVADVDAFPAIGSFTSLAVDSGDLGLGTVFEFLGDAGVGGEEEIDAFFLCGVEDVESEIQLVGLDAGITCGVALGFAEGVCHSSANEECVGFFHERGDDLDFIGDLGAAHDHEEGAFRILQLGIEIFEFALDEEAHGGGGDDLGHPLRGGVGAVGGAEGVIDEDVGLSGEFLGEGGVVRLLLAVETGVLEHEHLAWLEVLALFRSFGADAVGGSFDVFSEDLAEALGSRCQ